MAALAGLGFLLKLLLTAESLGNGFIFDSPMTTFLSLSHKPFALPPLSLCQPFVRRLHAGIYGGWHRLTL